VSLLGKLHALIDNSLEATFNKKPYDPTKDRAYVLKWIERTRSHLAQTEPVKGRKWAQFANGVMAFTPTRPDGGPLEINGATTVFVAVERAPDFLDHFAQAVEAGEFDHALATNGIGTSQHVSDAPVRKARKLRDPDAPRYAEGSRGWSPERRARFAETIAARKAAKD
jgi:hypothetical protein